MEKERRSISFLFCFFFLAIFVSDAMSRSFEDLSEQKNYYSPDPHSHTSSPPKHSNKKSPSCDTPSHGGGGTPSHGGGGTPSHGGGGTPTPTPSHGGGGGGGTPSHGGGGTPSHGGGGTPTPTPSHGGGGGGGGYSGNPPPSHGSGGYYNSPPSSGGSPSTPVINPPPTPVVDPVTPAPTTPVISTPPSPDPNTPPFFPAPCSYWGTHPAAIWALFGYWGTVGSIFGAACSLPYGRELTLQEALSNTRADGVGALYREGTAAFLNSMVAKQFPYSTQQVKDSFSAALVSDKAAANQAMLFKKANESRVKKH